jgi:4-hydroxy-tetrahydrodipicolinate synthase
VVNDLRQFDLTGYQAVLSVSPYYNKPSQEGLFQHYKAVSEQSPLPVMMYNVPGRTGMNVTAETTIRIARECSNIFATKEASGNMNQIMRILRDKPDGFDVISGDDAITLPMIALGATGVISVVANAYPRIFSDMVRDCLRGDFKAALPVHHRLLEVVETLFAEGSPAGVKAYMQELTLCPDHVRLPVVPVSDVLLLRIKRLMENL